MGPFASPLPEVVLPVLRSELGRRVGTGVGAAAEAADLVPEQFPGTEAAAEDTGGSLVRARMILYTLLLEKTHGA